MNESKNRLFFKIKSPFIHKTYKYIPYLNNKLGERGGHIYFEIIQDGLLYISRNLEVFSNIHSQPKKDFEKIHQLTKIPNEKLIKLEKTLPKNKFPKGGLDIFIKAENKDSEKALSILKKYYNELHPDIKASISEKSLKIVFTNFEALNHFVILISEVITRRGQQSTEN